MARKRYPLPKRFNLALSEKAYENLRGLNERYGFGNNYLLTFLLENIDSIADKKSLDEMYNKYIEEFGSPSQST